MSNRNRKSGKEKSAWQYYEVLPVGGLHLPLTSQKHRRSKQRNVGFAFLHFLCAKCLMECRVCWCWTKKKTTTHLCYSFITLTPWTCVCICVKCRKREEGKEGAGYSCSTIKTTHVFCFLHVFSFPIMLEPSSSHRNEGRKKNTSFSSLTKESSKGVGARLFFS